MPFATHLPRRARRRPTSPVSATRSPPPSGRSSSSAAAPWSDEAHDALIAWAEASRLPVASGWRCEGHVDNTSPVYVGHLGLGPDPRLAQRVRDADVILAIGTRLGDIETGGYSYLDIPRPGQRLIQVLPDPDELGRVFQPDVAIVSSPARFAVALSRARPARRRVWGAETERARADYLDNLRHVRRDGAGVDMGEVMAWLRGRLPEDATITNGAGNFSVWAHRFYEFRRYGTQLAPQSGAMGYGVPAAIAAKLVHPERIVVCIAGDGDFSMTGQELVTAVQYGAPVVVLVVDNGMLGTIRMHQERHYPGRVSGTDLVNPDFAALAAAYGAHGERSSGPRTSPRRSSARSRRACPACSSSSSTPRRSRRARPCRKSENPAAIVESSADRFH